MEWGAGCGACEGLAQLTKWYGGADLRVSFCVVLLWCVGGSLTAVVGAVYGGDFECCSEEVSADLQV